MRVGRARGFTLVETLIALVLSSFVIILVAHAFLVQNRFYATQAVRTSAQDNVRAATELIAREVRTALDSGVVAAGARTLTLRSPLAVAIVCDRPTGNTYDVFNEGGDLELYTDEVAGVGRRDPATGDWDTAYASWASIDGTSGDPAAGCAANGADTVGARDSYHRLVGINALFSPSPDVGDVLVLFRETTFTIRPSVMDPTTLGVFRAPYGQSAVEFATGIDTTARFRYRTAGGGFVDTVATASLPSIDAVRLVAEARKPAPTGGVDDITFGWSVTVPIRNVR